MSATFAPASRRGAPTPGRQIGMRAWLRGRAQRPRRDGPPRRGDDRRPDARHARASGGPLPEVRRYSSQYPPWRGLSRRQKGERGEFLRVTVAAPAAPLSLRPPPTRAPERLYGSLRGTSPGRQKHPPPSGLALTQRHRPPASAAARLASSTGSQGLRDTPGLFLLPSNAPLRSR